MNSDIRKKAGFLVLERLLMEDFVKLQNVTEKLERAQQRVAQIKGLKDLIYYERLCQI